MRVLLYQRAIRDLEKLTKNTRERIKKAIRRLESYPAVKNVRKILGASVVIDGRKYIPYRLRVGSYRIIFVVMDDAIIVVRVLPRSKAYKR